MRKVNIYKLTKNGQQELVAYCQIVDNVVVCNGEQNFLKILENKGITDYSKAQIEEQKKLFMKDGLLFLEQLKNNFTSPYLIAVEV